MEKYKVNPKDVIGYHITIDDHYLILSRCTCYDKEGNLIGNLKGVNLLTLEGEKSDGEIVPIEKFVIQQPPT